MLALRYNFQKLEREAPSTNRMCSKFKEANDFLKWQESDVHEMARTLMEKQEFKNHEFEKMSNKTPALPSLRTAQAGKSETRQNEKRYYKIQKRFYLSVDKCGDQSLIWIL